jgi:hypothetical protein
VRESVVLRDAIHLVCGDSAAWTLRAAGLNVRVDPDVMAVGPCDRDPLRHSQLRRAFWRSEFRLIGWPLPSWREVRWPRQGAVALWTSIWLVDRLFFWRAVDRLKDVELWRVEARAPGVGAMAREATAVRLAAASRMSRSEIAAARRTWAAFTSGDLPRVAGILEPSLRGVLLDCLPRVWGGRLRLSRRDEMLLRPFVDWRTPLEALRPELPRVLVFGDLVVLGRLQAWRRAGALESRPGPGKAPFTRLELRLTRAGRRLLDRLRSLWEAPLLIMGGHRIYGPRSWRLTSEGALRR